MTLRMSADTPVEERTTARLMSEEQYSIVNITSSPTKSSKSIRSSRKEGTLQPQGLYQPDGGDNPDEENDAKVWFQLSDSYEPPEPDLQVSGSLQGNVNSGTNHYALGTFIVANIGSDPEGFGDSYLDWAIAETPGWGSNWVFEPNSGQNLPSGDPVTVHVYVDVPDEQGTFSGSVKIWNTENHADYGLISVQLVAPVEKTVLQWNLFCKRFDGTLSKDVLSFLLNHCLR